MQLVTVHISFLSQQNIVKKEHHVSELDVNQKERGSGQISVQIIGQTFLSCIKNSHKDQYLQKPEFHYPRRRFEITWGPVLFILLGDRWKEKWIISHSFSRF